MNEQQYLDVISGKNNSLWSRILRQVFWLLSLVYRLASWTRNRWYDLGLKKSHSVGCPVISVGNLTTGGTGKTPMVAYVVQVLIELGLRPAIISRGYRSLEDGTNDEQRVLEFLCPGVPHIQDRDRVVAARRAISDFGCEIIVADDAFQHRRLRRNLDLVLIDATNPWGYGHLLPRGLMREARRELTRSHLVAITRADLISPKELLALVEHVKRQKTGPNRLGNNAPNDTPLIIAFRANSIISLNRKSYCLKEFQATHGKKVSGFCGLGNPEAFRQTIQQAGFELAEFTTFPDHHHYSAGEIETLVANANDGETQLITTLKDLVKIELLSDAAPIWALNIEAQILDGDEKLRAECLRIARPPANSADD